jgi:MFS family permease
LLPALFLALCMASIPFTGGRLWALSEVRLRHAWAIFAAIGLQILIISVFPDKLTGLDPYLHAGTYLLGGYFLLQNRHVPGFWLIGLGGAMNFLAIVTNGGTMPASSSALATAGLLHDAPNEFINSTVLGNPNLAFLGDIFATPSWLPFANVFSLGDVCIALGTGVAIHRICGSRLIPSPGSDFSTLIKNRPFMRLWIAQAASNFGDFAYAVAAVVTLTGHGAGPRTLATLLIAQVAPAAVVGVFGAPLVDRLSRKRIMVASDLLRTGAVLTLFLNPRPSALHFYVVAALLGSMGALFRPSMKASLPNMVPRRLLVAANSVVSATFHFALMAGPAVGGLLAAHLGPHPAFGINALSFVVSASMIVGLHLPRLRTEAEMAAATLKEGIRYSLSMPLVRSIMLVTGIAMFAAAIRAPNEPSFILHVINGKPEDIGFAEAAWGLGMLVGSAAAPGATRRWARMRLVSVGFGLIGFAVVVGSLATSLFTILLLWMVAGFGNAVATVSYGSLLQERTPDHLRGRVVAASEALLDGALVAGALLAGTVGAALGPRGAFLIAGVVFITASILGHLRVHTDAVPAPASEPKRDGLPALAIESAGTDPLPAS